MKWRVLRIGCTEVCIHPALLIYLTYAVLTGHGLFIGLALLSIFLHEMAHAGMAALLGQPPETIELTPLGAVMRLDEDHRLQGVKRFLTLAAGPAMTFLLCMLALWLGKRPGMPMIWGRILFLSNLSILLMNLLPVLPLDGGRMLALLLELLLPGRIVNRIMRWMGLLVGGGLIALNVFASWRLGGWNLSLAFAGCCILYASSAATITKAQAELRRFVDRKILLENRGICPSVCFSALHHTPVVKMVHLLPPGRIAWFACLEAGSMRNLGWMSEAELIQCYLRQPEITFGQAISLRYAEFGTE